jgi:hypothetical protein
LEVFAEFFDEEVLEELFDEEVCVRVGFEAVSLLPVRAVGLSAR